MYALDELLIKLGAPELREKKRLGWRSFNSSRDVLSGFAEVKLEDDEHKLTADLRYIHENHSERSESESSHILETFCMEAGRMGKGRYKIKRLTLDGFDYIQPTHAMIEWGMGLFRERAHKMRAMSLEKIDIVNADQREEEDGLQTGGQRMRMFFSPSGNVRRASPFGLILPFLSAKM